MIKEDNPGMSTIVALERLGGTEDSSGMSPIVLSCDIHETRVYIVILRTS